MQDGKKKKLQFYCFQLQHLERSILCVCLSLHSIGKEGGDTDMYSKDIQLITNKRKYKK